MKPQRRERVRHLAQRAGLEPQLKRAAQLLDPMSRRIRRDTDHLTVLLAATLDRDSSCVDVGAHAGDVLREMLRCAPDGRHVAFEPLPELAAGLERDFPQVDVHNAALSDAPGRAQFTVVDGAPEQSGLRTEAAAGTRQIDVDVQTLDTALPEDFAPRLVKIDVEGAEIEVVRGGVETIRRHRPIVVFEFGLGGADRFGHTPGDMYELLVGELGMRIYDIDGHGPYDARAWDEVFTKPLWNFIAR
jgi:FkbM family methyltransferase